MNIRIQDKAKETPFQKRLKRQVVGRVREYFAVTAPGLKGLCREELRQLPLPEKDIVAVSGGVRFSGRLVDCYTANLFLRTATRVLMRVVDFKATGFSRLQRKLAQVPWELFLSAGAMPDVKVSTRHCRLHHGDAIAGHVTDSIRSRLADVPVLPAPEVTGMPPQQVFIRGADDRFTVSVDSSGDNLYKRGLKQQGGKAPIRETLAAAVLKASGYSAKEPLIDPMCGTGTFSLEAGMLNLNIPAGWFRTFAFTGWPSFQPKRWDHLRMTCRKHFVEAIDPMIFASDRNGQACDRLSKVVRGNGLSTAISVSHGDFFSFSPADVISNPGLVVLNPPYGRRFGSLPEIGRLLNRIAHHLRSTYDGWRFALIVPRAHKVPNALKPFKNTRLLHGGLELKLITGKIGRSDR